MPVQRPLSTLGLSSAVLSSLLEADFVNDTDVKHMKPTELSTASGLTLLESSEVIRIAKSRNEKKPISVHEMLEHDTGANYIVSFCKSIDILLGGGLPLGVITEISGTPGIGKTQMCLQACVSVQLPEILGGVNGEAVFIDTEGSFTAMRLKEIAYHAEQHVKSFSESKDDISSFTVDQILKRIHYYRCHSYLEVVAIIQTFPKLYQAHPNIRLLIIDSVAFHFRHNFSDIIARTGILCSLTQDLIQLASKNHLSVLVTNQMTTKFEPNSREGMLVAALGESWGHCPTIRIYLYWTNQNREASLIKAPHRMNGIASYQVTAEGIRDVLDTSN